MRAIGKEAATAAVAVAVVAVLIASYVLLAPPSSSNVRPIGLSRPAPPTYAVRVGNWTGVDATVTASCPSCTVEQPSGASVSVVLEVQPRCGPYGCSTTLEAVGADSPYRLLASAPAAPTPLAAAGTPIDLTVRLPEGPGPYTINGTVDASAPPAPVDITSLSWTPRNASGGDNGISIRPSVVTPLVAPGSAFNVSLYVNNTSPVFSIITSLTLAPPFSIIFTGPGLPFEIDPNWSWEIFAEVRAPNVSGNYSLAGLANVTALPLDIIGWVNVSFVGLSVPITLVSTSIYKYQFPGAEFNGSILLGNPTNESHQLALNHTTGPWFFVNSTPSGHFVIPANGTYRVYVSMSDVDPPGTYGLGLVFSIYSEPSAPMGCARRPREGRPRPGGRVRGPSGRALRPSPRRAPPRTPG